MIADQRHTGFLRPLLLLLLMLAGFTSASRALTLAWDPSPGANIAGYKVYYGAASRTYTSMINAGNMTNAIINSLSPGLTYFFATTSYDSDGMENDYSTELTYTVPVSSSAPTVALSSPADGVTYTAPTSISLSATITANGHAISKVQFYNGSVLLGEVAALPYNFAWNNVSAGTYSLIARVVYDGGSMLDSSPANITVGFPRPASGLTFAADSGAITAPFVALNGIVSQSIETGVTTGGRAAYTFTITNAGDYIVSADVNAPSLGANSFYVNVDADPTDPMMIWDILPTTGFTNQPVTWRGSGASTLRVFTLAQGTHELIIRGREAGTQLGAITISRFGYVPPPVVTLIAPADGTSYTAPATVNLAADVAANGHDITKVQFYNGATLLGESASAPYTLAWNNVTAGSFIVSARAVYDTDATIDSVPVNVLVTNPPPIIALDSPTSGATYTAPATVNIAATVTANGHTINKVQFYNGTTLLGESAAAPYAFSWSNVSSGNYALSAMALYDSGSTAASTSLPIVVSVPPNPSGLVAAYGFEEGDGPSVADASGQGNTGSLSGATWSSAGRFGHSLSFDGATSAVVINDSPALDLTSGMTLEAWVYPTATDTWRDVLYKGDDLYYLEAASPVSGPCAGVGNSATNGVLATPSSLALNTWSHLAATYDGATLRLFVNGLQVASQAWPEAIATSSLPLSIGADTLHGSHFAGLIDEVRVYNRPLSAGEIQRDLNTPVSISVSNPAPSNLSFAAGSGVVTAPFVNLNGVISQSIGTDLTTGGRAVYTFTITNAGDYIISANVSAPNNGANSFYVNIDSEPSDPTMIWNIPVGSGFANQTVTWRGNGATDPPAPQIFTLDQGTHQLIIGGREAGVQLSAITISRLTLPLPWQATDIGTAAAGSAAIASGYYTISGAGILNGSSDNFRFVYQTLSGDGEVTAQLSSVQNTGPNGLVGVMIRETLTPGSSYAFVGLSPDGNFRLQRRPTTGGGTWGATAGTATAPDAWVRIVRSGDTITRYFSTDGLNWSQGDSRTFTMAANIYIGIAVASGAPDTLNTSTLSNLLLVP